MDVWTFAATKGQTYTCEVNALRLGSPLDARLEVLGPDGRRLAEKVGDGSDPLLRFTAPADGKYAVRIHDAVGIGLAVKVAHAGALYGFRADGVRAAIIDGPHQYGATQGLDALDQRFI